jgi:signal transduction histidine kinase
MPDRTTVRTELDPALPPLTGEPVQLQQVIANLVVNAFEAMGPVTHRPRILRVATQLSGPGTVLVSVEDTGSGLSADLRQRIFEPFFTTKPEGMGMGLLFCRSIVEGHGGRLWVDAGTGGGAIIRFSLPADEDGAGARVEADR